MKTWHGAAGICINEKSELLMVLEGRLEKEEKWSLPSGGLEENETFEECVIREIAEETGYIAEVIKELKIKRGRYEDIDIAYEVHYFSVKVTGGQAQIQDPDNLIRDIEWKSEEQLRTLELNYPEDREELISHLKKTALAQSAQN